MLRCIGKVAPFAFFINDLGYNIPAVITYLDYRVAAVMTSIGPLDTLGNALNRAELGHKDGLPPAH